MKPPAPSSAIREDVVCFSVLGQPVAVRSASEEALEAFLRLYQHFPMRRDVSSTHVVEVVERSDAGAMLEAVAKDLDPLRQLLGAVSQRAEGSLCIHALQQPNRLVGLHAATIAFGDSLALITGDSGAGKTTLTLALAARGYAIDGDDMAMLDPETGWVTGLPRCFHLDDASIELLAGQGMDVRALERCEGFLTPADVGDAGMQARAVKAVFFLVRDDLEEPVIRPLVLADAVARLHEQWGPRFISSTQLFGMLRAMLSRSRWFEIRRGPLGATADGVVRTMEGLGG